MFCHCRHSRATAAIQNFIRPPVLWTLVVVTLSVSGALVGFSISKTMSLNEQVSTANPNDADKCPDPNASAHCTSNPKFVGLLSSFFLQILSSYCHLVPILDDHMRRKEIDVHHYIFYFSIATSMLTAMLAPILFCNKGKGLELSIVMNFLANIFDVVTATQLAGGIMKLNR
ncbi:hypothetical protein PFICI_01481 [Pestalotiopsis fici W106-1]|uniref:Uncharacterized protein n=1 Tax=Pestalotiopsis fici (strain W106-1 / CGMCC3.15140) TaxID=1229662 RepID=W3XNM0_PESFW|nr:uncharacterized protein PFICI_01481 [Pestalotiopsis fici W106-1]ETS87653.1 hypothetical protein PFICI_01481 [Pestalotiopsis fici W106-1]